MGTKRRPSFLTAPTSREMRCATKLLPCVKKSMDSKKRELFLTLTLHGGGGETM